MPLRSEMTLGEFVKLKKGLQDNVAGLMLEFERTTGAAVEGLHIVHHEFETREIGILPPQDKSIHAEVRLPI